MRVGCVDEVRGIMVQSLSLYQGYIWKVIMTIALLDLEIIQHCTSVTMEVLPHV